MTSEKSARRFFLVLMITTTALLCAVVLPLATALFLAIALAAVLWPVQLRLARALGKRPSLSAGILAASVVLLLIGPLVAFSAFAIKEGTEGWAFVSKTVRSEGVAGLIDRMPGPLQRLGQAALKRMPQDAGALNDTIREQVTAQGGRAAEAVGAAVAATSSFVFQSTMMLIALFFLLVHGDELVHWLDDLSPLRPGQTKELLTDFKKVSYAVIVSTAVTAFVQAVAALVGYYIARVPHPIFFGGVTFFVALIPAIGAAAVCIVAALLLFVTGHPYMAIFLAAWGIIVVGLVDNIVKPLLIRGGVQMHGAVVFFALIGGLATFGGIGLLVGPLVVALFLSLVRIYRRDFAREQVAGS